MIQNDIDVGDNDNEERKKNMLIKRRPIDGDPTASKPLINPVILKH